ncbi:MAG: hypothetical protein QM669_04240 [Siphonobacter sp.]
MRKYILLVGLMLFTKVVYAQNRFFIKASAGPSFPYGKFEDQQTQDLAKLLKTGPNYALSVGYDLFRHWGLALTGTAWTHDVKNERMKNYLVNAYIPVAFQSYIKSLSTSSEKFEFRTITFSPYYTFNFASRFRVDIRAHAGIMHMRFPVITGTGTGTSPIDNQDYDLSVQTQSSNSTTFIYGAGGSLYYCLSKNFRFFVDVDGLRAEPKFDDIVVSGSLGAISLNTTRPAFSQTAGTLSTRLGISFFL